MSKTSLSVQRAVEAMKPDQVLAQPPNIVIPDSLKELTSSMNALGTGVMLAGWATAATVYAWTEPGRGGPRTGREVGQLSEREFAELGIRGLSSRDSVRAYRSRWEDAINAGIADEVAPGSVVRLPEVDFRPPAVEAADAEPEMAHVGQATGESEWYTPQAYIDAARVVMGGIDLDPASNAIANEVVGATEFYSIEDSGLDHGWHGCVWMNPPYSQPLVYQFCEKLGEEVAGGNVDQAIVLINNTTETVMFQRMTEVAKAICFPSGRVRFWHPDKESATPLQGQAVIYFGERVKEFCTEFRAFGFTVAIVG